MFKSVVLGDPCDCHWASEFCPFCHSTPRNKIYQRESRFTRIKERLIVAAFVFFPGCGDFQRGLREWPPHRAYMTLI